MCLLQRLGLAATHRLAAAPGELVEGPRKEQGAQPPIHTCIHMATVKVLFEFKLSDASRHANSSAATCARRQSRVKVRVKRVVCHER